MECPFIIHKISPISKSVVGTQFRYGRKKPHKREDAKESEFLGIYYEKVIYKTINDNGMLLVCFYD